MNELNDGFHIGFQGHVKIIDPETQQVLLNKAATQPHNGANVSQKQKEPYKGRETK